jgi:hypothetical protein
MGPTGLFKVTQECCWYNRATRQTHLPGLLFGLPHIPGQTVMLPEQAADLTGSRKWGSGGDEMVGKERVNAVSLI